VFYSNYIGVSLLPMLLETKFLVPVVPPQLMARERLIKQLGVPKPAQLSLLQAPPGYGKTTLIIQWLSSCELSPVWLSLDGRDNDLLRFWRYLVGAIQRCDERIAPKSHAMLLDLPLGDIDQLVEALINELLNWRGEGVDPMIVVLDDYHVISHEPIHQSMAYFFDNLPATVHVVVASRTQPPLFIERRKVRGQLVEITSVELAFIPEETELFLKQRFTGVVSQDSIFVLQKRTEGWAAAVQLAVLSMQKNSLQGDSLSSNRAQPVVRENSVLTKTLTDLDEEVIRYLFDEVISSLDLPVRDFVINTSPLACFSSELLNEIYAIDSSNDIIDTLKEKNLFIQSLHGEDDWYRFHELFREALLFHFDKKPVDERHRLHVRAAAAFEAMQHKEEALEHYLAAEQWQSASELVEDISYGRVLGSEDALSESLLEKLPDSELQSRPKLLLIKAWSLFRSNNISPAASYLDRIEELLDGGDVIMADDELKQLLRHVAVYRTQLAHISGDPQSARRLMAEHEGLLQSPDQDEDLGVQLGVVIDYFVRGDMTNIIKYGPAILSKAKRENNQFVALSLAQTLGMALYYGGEVKGSFDCFSEFHRWIDSVGVDPGLAVGWSDICKLDMYRETNQFDKVAECWRNLRSYTGTAAMPGQKALTDITYANALMGERRYDEADRLLRIAQEDFSDHLSFWSFISPPIDMFLAKLALFEGKTSVVVAWANQEEKRLREITYYRSEEERFLLIRADIFQERFDQADSLLAFILEDSVRYGRMLSAARAFVLRVLLCDAQQDNSGARDFLKQAVVIGEQAGYCRVFLDDWVIVGPLLQRLRGLTAPLLAYRESLEKQAALQVNASDTEDLRLENRKAKESLTPREIEILWLIKQGLKNVEIADRLSISANTAKVHIRNLYEKLVVKSRTQAVSRAQEIGVFSS